MKSIARVLCTFLENALIVSLMAIAPMWPPASNAKSPPLAGQGKAATTGQPPASNAKSHPAQAQNQENQYYFCEGYYLPWNSPSNLRPNTLLLSGVFQSGEKHATIDLAWRKYIGTKYGGTAPSGMCRGGTTQADMEKLRASRAQDPVVEVDWKYTPDQAVAWVIKSYCYSDPDAPLIYFSDIFDTNVPPNNQFLPYLQQKYSYKTNAKYPVVCPLIASIGLGEAEASKEKLKAQLGRAKKQIIETGWKYKPDQAVAASAPSAGHSASQVSTRGATAILGLPPERGPAVR
jgi:hypothetical protein